MPEEPKVYHVIINWNGIMGGRFGSPLMIFLDDGFDVVGSHQPLRFFDTMSSPNYFPLP
jgi:hypothetical protein